MNPKFQTTKAKIKKMINLYPTQIETISLHRVGNKNKNEGIFLSSEPFMLNDETTGLLKEYFF